MLLPEHGGRSAGASDSPQKTAPSAGNHFDMQYFPGFALRQTFPSHTVISSLFFLLIDNDDVMNMQNVLS